MKSVFAESLKVQPDEAPDAGEGGAAHAFGPQFGPQFEPKPGAKFGPKFVDEVIQALGELDAEHLRALAQAAERFLEEATPRLTPDEAAEMQAKMRLFAAILAETRRNLRLFALTAGKPDEFGYRPGRARWVD